LIFPSLEEAKKLAENGNVIPVCKTILADTETPVSVWMKLFRKERYNFLLESVEGQDTVARYSFLGGAPFMTFTCRGTSWTVAGEKNHSGDSDPISALRALLAEYKAVAVSGAPRFCGGAVGFFTYDSIRLRENIPDKNPKSDPLDDIFFGFYKELVVFDNKEHRLMLISNIILDAATDLESAYRAALYEIGRMQDRLSVRLQVSSLRVKELSPAVSNCTQSGFEAGVEKCREYIRAGDIFQAVYSQRFSIGVEADPFDLYRILRVINPSPYMYYCAMGDTSIIGASPEMLVRVEAGEVQVRPIAGTRKRGRNEDEDEALVKELLADPKERAEHVMLVDLGRNDVGRVSRYGSVRVEKMMHIEKYSHVIHIVSNVRGHLAEGKDAFDALFSCFPAGTLSGAPKIRAMEIIDELETVKRGLYGGALGYIDFNGTMDTCIVIRTIVYHDKQAIIQAGAGIVADSVPEKEYQETLQKAGALFSAITQASAIVGR
jgi:anthranilate synthase component I